MENDFKFIAFDQATGMPLAHGSRAIDALARADLAAPDAWIEIIATGLAGRKFWSESLSLSEVKEKIAAAEEKLRPMRNQVPPMRNHWRHYLGLGLPARVRPSDKVMNYQNLE